MIFDFRGEPPPADYPDTRAAIAEYEATKLPYYGVLEHTAARRKVLEAYARESSSFVDESMTPSYILWLIDGGQQADN